MHRVLKAKRLELKVLRQQKRQLVQELRQKRAQKKELDQQMATIRSEIKHIKGVGRSF
jgi:chromosome segregation ATPase